MVRRTTKNLSAEDGRHLLMARRSELISALTGRPSEVIARSDRLAEDDHPTVLHDEFVSLEMNRIAFHQLRLVDTALALIASGDYGVCQDCGEHISAKRLRAVPWARYCVGCEERLSQADDQGNGAPGTSGFKPVDNARGP